MVTSSESRHATSSVAELTSVALQLFFCAQPGATMSKETVKSEVIMMFILRTPKMYMC